MKTASTTLMAALAAFYAHALEPVNLKDLAAHWTEDDKDRFVLGTGDFSDSKWDWTKERVYDGYVQVDNDGATRWFEPTWAGAANENAWSGYGVAEPVVVTRIRFMPRHDEYASRAVGCRFEGANTADFSDAVTLYTVPETDVETLKTGWQEVAAPDASTRSFLYLRVIGDYCGNMIEVEFYGSKWADVTSAAPVSAPQNLAIASADKDTGEVALTWEAPAEPCVSAIITRSTAPGGSTFDFTDTVPATTTTYTDTDPSRVPGVTYYYSVAFANGDKTGPASNAASGKFITAIPVTVGENGTSIVEFDHDYEAETKTSAAKLFDGDTATKPDVVNGSNGNTGVAVGVDFGEGNECVVAGFAVFPSREWNNSLDQWVVGRSDGIVLNGSNNSGNWREGAAISAACEMYKENVWDDTRLSWQSFETTDAATAFRYIYLTKPERDNLTDQKTNDFYGNVRELKLYGWNAAAAEAVLTAPGSAGAAWRGSHADIGWTAASNAAASYRVERSVNGGDWVTVAEGLTALAFTDSPDHPTLDKFAYRVGAVDNSGNIAYTLPVVPTGTPAPRGFVIKIR